jgi:hypothetical protein
MIVVPVVIMLVARLHSSAKAIPAAKLSRRMEVVPGRATSVKYDLGANPKWQAAHPQIWPELKILLRGPMFLKFRNFCKKCASRLHGDIEDFL